MKFAPAAVCVATSFAFASPVAQAQFDAPVTIDTSFVGVPALVATDLDGDGDDDQVAWNFNGQIEWRESRQDGRVALLQPAGPVITGSLGPLTLVAFDADGDGREDLFASSRSDGAMVALNEGGRYGDFQTIAPASPEQIVVGPLDMDGDGRLDLITRTDGAAGLLWARNAGGGAFDPPVRVWNAAADVVDAIIVDLDNDGDDDILAITGEFPGRVLAAVNVALPGQMRQLLVADLPTDGGEARLVRAADLDGDNLPELFAIRSWRT